MAPISKENWSWFDIKHFCVQSTAVTQVHSLQRGMCWQPTQWTMPPFRINNFHYGRPSNQAKPMATFYWNTLFPLMSVCSLENKHIKRCSLYERHKRGLSCRLVRILPRPPQPLESVHPLKTQLCGQHHVRLNSLPLSPKPDFIKNKRPVYKANS